MGFTGHGNPDIADGEIHTIAKVDTTVAEPGYLLEGKGDWMYGEFRFEATDEPKVDFRVGDIVYTTKKEFSEDGWDGPMEVVFNNGEGFIRCKHPRQSIGFFFPNELRKEGMEKKEEVLQKKETGMVNFHVLKESIVLNYDGKTHVIAKGDDRYEGVLACIRSNDLVGIPAIVEIERGFNGSGLELKDGLVYAEGTPIPTELNNRILAYKEAKIPYDSLLKFWDRLKKNPSFNARLMLFKFLEHNGIAFTQDGHFIAYRGVTEDFKDCHTQSFDNKPGSICHMDRSLVDDNPNNTCSTGLHVACFSYAKGFGAKLVEVKVDPADVVAVPTDYDNTKMRVCRFEVIQECKQENAELVKELPKTGTDRNTNYRHSVRGPNGRFASK